jgi:hypothetical protein
VILFVGEKRSQRAIDLGLTWKDGGLAAKPLFEALHAMGLRPEDQTFMNLWPDHSERVPWQRLARIRAHDLVVAMGQKVSRELERAGIEHTYIVHPAARGKIRKRSRYVNHVRKTLKGLV